MGFPISLNEFSVNSLEENDKTILLPYSLRELLQFGPYLSQVYESNLDEKYHGRDQEDFEEDADEVVNFC